MNVVSFQHAQMALFGQQSSPIAIPLVIAIKKEMAHCEICGYASTQDEHVIINDIFFGNTLKRSVGAPNAKKSLAQKTAYVGTKSCVDKLYKCWLCAKQEHTNWIPVVDRTWFTNKKTTERIKICVFILPKNSGISNMVSIDAGSRHRKTIFYSEENVVNMNGLT